MGRNPWMKANEQSEEERMKLDDALSRACNVSILPRSPARDEALGSIDAGRAFLADLCRAFRMDPCNVLTPCLSPLTLQHMFIWSTTHWSHTNKDAQNVDSITDKTFKEGGDSSPGRHRFLRC